MIRDLLAEWLGWLIPWFFLVFGGGVLYWLGRSDGRRAESRDRDDYRRLVAVAHEDLFATVPIPTQRAGER